jgi:hypothetical protein
MIISNSENPRFPLDFIVSLGVEEQPKRARAPVRHGHGVEDRANNTTGSRSFIAIVIFVAVGDVVKVLRANAPGHTTFVIRGWLLELLNDDWTVPARAEVVGDKGKQAGWIMLHAYELLL